MANLMDYLNWRGDLSFRDSPINDVDSLIFSNLSYVAFDTILPSPWEPEQMPLWRASEKYWEQNREREQLERFSLIKMAPFSMRRMAETNRFRDVPLMYYQNSVNSQVGSQFSAMCMQLPDQKYYIAFRGTDDTIIGWRENFRMSYEMVPAQQKAVDYLNYVGERCRGELWLGGHSKGGNLAVYAAANARPAVQKRIRKIYNFDGPGFSQRMLNSERYGKIADRIRKYVPTDSVIGMLLEQDENYQVVSSMGQGLQQHDPVNWRILGDQFVYMPREQKTGQRINQMVHDWIYGLTLEERKQVVEAVFQAMEDSQIETLNDLGKNQWKKKFWLVRGKLRENQECYGMVKKAGRQMLHEFQKIITGRVRSG